MSGRAIPLTSRGGYNSLSPATMSALSLPLGLPLNEREVVGGCASTMIISLYRRN